jgi:hypothetical protein
VSLCIPSSSRSPDHDPHRTIYYLGYPLGRFAGLKHRQLARQVGVIITTGRIRRILVNKINLLVDSPRSIEASRLALVKAKSIFLRRASGCFGSSRGSSRHSSSTTPPRAGSSSTTSPPPRVRVPRLVTRLVAPLVVWYFASRRLVIDYFAYAVRPGASARRAARRVARCAARRRLLRLTQARRRLLRFRRTSGCLCTSRGSSRGSSSNTSLPPHVRVPRHVTRIVTRLVVDYFAYAARLGASARHAAHRFSSTMSPTPRDRVPRHVARLVAWLVAPLVVDYSTSRRLVVEYFASAARPGASARRAARLVARCATRRQLLRLVQAHRRLLRLRRASGCLGTSRGSSRRSSSTTSPTPRVWVPRHVARLIAFHRLLRLRRATGCLGTSHGSSRGSLHTRRRLLRLA